MREAKIRFDSIRSSCNQHKHKSNTIPSNKRKNSSPSSANCFLLLLGSIIGIQVVVLAVSKILIVGLSSVLTSIVLCLRYGYSHDGKNAGGSLHLLAAEVALPALSLWSQVTGTN